MKLWEAVCKTDARYTKQAKVGGQQITSLSGTAMIMKATEEFGPVGIGFGWSVTEERFDPGPEIFSGEGDNRFSLGHELNHTVKILFWFMRDGQRGEIEQYGCTPYMYKSKYGVTTDGEAPKKSLTDAIKKALSMLGFSADVFLGMFDDQDYVAERQSEAALEQAEDKEAEIERQKEERLQWLKDAVETLESAGSEHELKKLHTSYVRTATRRNEDKFIKRLTLAFESRMAEFKQPAEVE
tara:strand:- start:11115 stop:11834 length:720 start_codon:yes stop_codon:yes gene_type:complete